MPVIRVIDASVLIKAYVPEVLSEQAGGVMESMARGSVRYIAPDLVYPELGNILWKKHGLKELEAAVVQDIIDPF